VEGVVSQLVIVDVQQGSDQWHTLRRSKRPASMTPMVTGTSRFGGIAEAYDFFVRGEGATENAAMRYGREMEPKARAELELALQETGEPAVGYRGDYLASLDFYSRNWIVDIKCPYSGTMSPTWKAAISGEIEPQYAEQLEHQYRVFGSDRIGLYVWTPGGAIFVEYKPDKGRWDNIRRAWDEFFEKYVSKRVRPTDCETRDDSQWLSLAASLIETNAKVAELSAQADSIKRKLKELAGEASATGGGVTVRRYWRNQQIDKDAAIRELLPPWESFDDYVKRFATGGRWEQRVTIDRSIGNVERE
jgi:putative phage-type endonuclease